MTASKLEVAPTHTDHERAGDDGFVDQDISKAPEAHSAWLGLRAQRTMEVEVGRKVGYRLHVHTNTNDF